MTLSDFARSRFESVTPFMSVLAFLPCMRYFYVWNDDWPSGALPFLGIRLLNIFSSKSRHRIGLSVGKTGVDDGVC